MKKMGVTLAFLLIVAFLIGSISCGGKQTTPTDTPTPTLTPTPAPSATPTATPVAIILHPSVPYLHTIRQVYSSVNLTFNEVSAFGSYNVSSILPADLDNDGDMDLILGSEENNSIIQVYENIGGGVFRNSGCTFAFQSPDERHWNFGITVADFNGDGLPDIASADAWAGLNIYFNYGKLQFAQVQNYTFEGMGEVKGIASADLNNDGYIDIILGDHNGTNLGDRVLFNNGTGKLVDSGQSISWDITWDVFAIDINRDGAIDYISVNRYGEEPSRVHLNDGHGFFRTTYDIPDALDDSSDVKCLVYGNYTYCFIANNEGTSKRQNRILVFDKNGKLTDGIRFGVVGAETKDMGLADLNSDGLQDLITANYNWGSTAYFANCDNEGLLSFKESMPLFSIETTSSIGCGDFNGDGLIDFVVGIAQNTVNPGEPTGKYYLLLQVKSQ